MGRLVGRYSPVQMEAFTKRVPSEKKVPGVVSVQLECDWEMVCEDTYNSKRYDDKQV